MAEKIAYDYRITEFYRHPKIDRKVMRVLVSERDNPDSKVEREFYWEQSAYVKQGQELPDETLIAEVRQLLDVPSDYPPLVLP